MEGSKLYMYSFEQPFKATTIFSILISATFPVSYLTSYYHFFLFFPKLSFSLRLKRLGVPIAILVQGNLIPSYFFFYPQFAAAINARNHVTYYRAHGLESLRNFPPIG